MAPSAPGSSSSSSSFAHHPRHSSNQPHQQKQQQAVSHGPYGPPPTPSASSSSHQQHPQQQQQQKQPQNPLQGGGSGSGSGGVGGPSGVGVMSNKSNPHQPHLQQSPHPYGRQNSGGGRFGPRGGGGGGGGRGWDRGGGRGWKGFRGSSGGRGGGGRGRGGGGEFHRSDSFVARYGGGGGGGGMGVKDGNDFRGGGGVGGGVRVGGGGVDGGDQSRVNDRVPSDGFGRVPVGMNRSENTPSQHPHSHNPHRPAMVRGYSGNRGMEGVGSGIVGPSGVGRRGGFGGVMNRSSSFSQRGDGISGSGDDIGVGSGKMNQGPSNSNHNHQQSQSHQKQQQQQHHHHHGKKGDGYGSLTGPHENDMDVDPSRGGGGGVGGFPSSPSMSRGGGPSSRHSFLKRDRDFNRSQSSFGDEGPYGRPPAVPSNALISRSSESIDAPYFRQSSDGVYRERSEGNIFRRGSGGGSGSSIGVDGIGSQGHLNRNHNKSNSSTNSVDGVGSGPSFERQRSSDDGFRSPYERSRGVGGGVVDGFSRMDRQRSSDGPDVFRKGGMRDRQRDGPVGGVGAGTGGGAGAGPGPGVGPVSSVVGPSSQPRRMSSYSSLADAPLAAPSRQRSGEYRSSPSQTGRKTSVFSADMSGPSPSVGAPMLASSASASSSSSSALLSRVTSGEYGVGVVRGGSGMGRIPDLERQGSSHSQPPSRSGSHSNSQSTGHSDVGSVRRSSHGQRVSDDVGGASVLDRRVDRSDVRRGVKSEASVSVGVGDGGLNDSRGQSLGPSSSSSKSLSRSSHVKSSGDVRSSTTTTTTTKKTTSKTTTSKATDPVGSSRPAKQPSTSASGPSSSLSSSSSSSLQASVVPSSRREAPKPSRLTCDDLGDASDRATETVRALSILLSDSSLVEESGDASSVFLPPMEKIMKGRSKIDAAMKTKAAEGEACSDAVAAIELEIVAETEREKQEALDREKQEAERVALAKRELLELESLLQKELEDRLLGQAKERESMVRVGEEAVLKGMSDEKSRLLLEIGEQMDIAARSVDEDIVKAEDRVSVGSLALSEADGVVKLVKEEYAALCNDPCGPVVFDEQHTSNVVNSVLSENLRKAKAAQADAMSFLWNGGEDSEDGNGGDKKDGDGGVDAVLDPVYGRTNAEWSRLATQVTGRSTALYSKPSEMVYFDHNERNHARIAPLVAEAIARKRGRMLEAWEGLAEEYVGRKHLYDSKSKRRGSTVEQSSGVKRRGRASILNIGDGNGDGNGIGVGGRGESSGGIGGVGSSSTSSSGPSGAVSTPSGGRSTSNPYRSSRRRGQVGGVGDVVRSEYEQEQIIAELTAQDAMEKRIAQGGCEVPRQVCDVERVSVLMCLFVCHVLFDVLIDVV